MDDLIDAAESGREMIRLEVRPNAFLYALEASRIYLVIVLAMVILLFPYAVLKSGVPIGLATRLALTVYGLTGFIFFVGMMIASRCMAFLITNKSVIVRMSVMGRISDRISIPIESIESIEVRCYDAQHGSVYIKCGEALPDLDSRSDISDDARTASLHGPLKQPRQLASPIVRSGLASIWFSIPSGAVGFYGFRHYNAFATLIVDLKTAA